MASERLKTRRQFLRGIDPLSTFSPKDPTPIAGPEQLVMTTGQLVAITSRSVTVEDDETGAQLSIEVTQIGTLEVGDLVTVDETQEQGLVVSPLYSGFDGRLDWIDETEMSVGGRSVKRGSLRIRDATGRKSPDDVVGESVRVLVRKNVRTGVDTAEVIIVRSDSAVGR